MEEAYPHLSPEELRDLLRRSKREMEEFTNSVPGAVVSFKEDDGRDEGLDLIRFSDGLCRMTGYTREEIFDELGGHYRLLILPEDRAAVHREAVEQAGRDPEGLKELKYRIRRKDGRTLWVLDRGRLSTLPEGERIYHNIILDIDAMVRDREELRLSLERHQIILRQSRDIIFEWDIPQDTVMLSDNWERVFGWRPATNRVSEGFHQWGILHPDDEAAVFLLLNHLRTGAPYAELEARFKDGVGYYRWCRIRATLQLDGDGVPAKAVGVIQDIDEGKRTTERLQELAERDALTGVYNRGAAQPLMEAAVAGATADRPCALLVMDLDEFKLINDTLGHQKGDALLMEFANILRKSFRKNDLISRIGGDEFCVVMHDAGDRADVERKVAEVQNALREMFRRGYPIFGSCSIGGALAPEDGGDFETLFRRADAALYQVKSGGKNSMLFFGSSAGESVEEACEEGENAHPGSLWDKVAQHAFQVLYRSNDPETAVGIILEIAGRRLSAGRAWLMELSEDGTGFRRTFRWEGGTAPKGVEDLSWLGRGQLGEVFRALDRDGVFTCEDTRQMNGPYRTVLEAQGTRSILLCAVREDGRLRGIIGVEDCQEPRRWIRPQRSVAAFLAELVSVFLLRERARRLERARMESLEAILDAQESPLYVVDRFSREVLYANEPLRHRMEGRGLEEPCYVRLEGRTVPCPDCPLDFSSGANDFKMLRRDPDTGRRYTLKMTPVLWEGGRSACCLCRLPCGRHEEAPV